MQNQFTINISVDFEFKVKVTFVSCKCISRMTCVFLFLTGCVSRFEALPPWRSCRTTQQTGTQWCCWTSCVPLSSSMTLACRECLPTSSSPWLSPLMEYPIRAWVRISDDWYLLSLSINYLFPKENTCTLLTPENYCRQEMF